MSAQKALELVREGAEKYQGERGYELHAYHSLVKAHMNTEKLDVLSMHLEAMQQALTATAAAAGAITPTAPGPVTTPAANV